MFFSQYIKRFAVFPEKFISRLLSEPNIINNLYTTGIYSKIKKNFYKKTKEKLQHSLRAMSWEIHFLYCYFFL